MRRIAGVNIEDIKETEIVSEPLLKKINAHRENAKLWKYAFGAVVVGIIATYVLRLFLNKDSDVEFTSTRPGFFLMTFVTLSFIAFAVLFIREKSFLKNKWCCPKCNERFPYIKSESKEGTECERREFIIDCNTLEIRQAALENEPFIIPRKCPNCNEILWKRTK